MSQTLEERELTGEEEEGIIEFEVEEVEKEKDKVLIVELVDRKISCEYATFIVKSKLQIIDGKAEVKTLRIWNYGECDKREEVVIIPKTVPTVVKVTYIDGAIDRPNVVCYHIFTGESWERIEMEVYDP